MPNDCSWSNYIPKIYAWCLYNACQNEIRRNYLQILKYRLSNPFLLQYYCSVKYRKIKMKVKKEKSFSLLYIKKQPYRGVLRKRCYENMQQIHSRTPMPKCDFNKVASQLYWNHTLAWVFVRPPFSIFSEHLFLRTPLKGCFDTWKNS